MSPSAAAKRGPRLVEAGNVSVAELGAELPQNLEAERSILGAVLLDNSYFAVAAKFVGTYDFFLPQHRHIYERMVVMDDRQIGIDLVTLIENLRAEDLLEASGGAAYISQLTDGMPRVSNIEHYARIVREKARLRTAIENAYALQQRALQRDAQVDDLREYVERINRITAPAEPSIEALTIPDMPEDVLDSRLGEICQRRLAGFPLAYAWTALLAVASPLVPRSSPARTNLYSCVVGPIGSGKSHSIRSAVHVMGLTKPLLESTLAGSAEGLLEKLSDAGGERRLLSPDELGHLLTKAKIDCASFPYVLNTAFYQDEFELTAARGKKIHFHCSLGIVGGIVEENFEQCFGAATTGGLYDRFLFGLCPQPFSYEYRPIEGTPELTEPCDVIIGRDVWEARDSWMRSIPDISPRCAELALRAAVVAAAFSGRTLLEARHLAPARALAEYQARIRKKLKPNPGENADARCAFAILGVLDRANGWILKRDVSRRIHSDRFGPSVFERAVSSLQAVGELVVDPMKPVKLRRVSQ